MPRAYAAGRPVEIEFKHQLLPPISPPPTNTITTTRPFITCYSSHAPNHDTHISLHTTSRPLPYVPLPSLAFVPVKTREYWPCQAKTRDMPLRTHRQRSGASLQQYRDTRGQRAGGTSQHQIAELKGCCQSRISTVWALELLPSPSLLLSAIPGKEEGSPIEEVPSRQYMSWALIRSGHRRP